MDSRFQDAEQRERVCLIGPVQACVGPLGSSRIKHHTAGHSITFSTDLEQFGLR